MVASWIEAQKGWFMERVEFLYLVRPARPAMLTDGMSEFEETAVTDHFNYLKDLAEVGTVRLAGRTLENATAFGIVVFTAASRDHAQRLVDGDPAVARGVMTAELFAFRTAVDQTLT